MRRVCRAVVTGLTVGCLGQVAAQSPPDFSGTWILERAVATAGGVRTVQTTGVNGAPFSCGTECVIVHHGDTVAISRPADERGVRRPDVVLKTDGTPSAIRLAVQSTVEYQAVARWDGDTLVVTRPLGVMNIRQHVSIDDGRLIVASAANQTGNMETPIRQIYVRK